MSEKPEALRLADDLDFWPQSECSEAAAELRRQHAEITRLRVAVLGQSADLATLRAQNYETQSLLAGAEAECDALRAEVAALQSQVNAFYLGTPESRLLAMTKECDALRAALNKLEYDSEGYIKRYPEESEVNAALKEPK